MSSLYLFLQLSKLLASMNADQICEEGIVNFVSLPHDSSLSLDELQSALCEVNVSSLLEHVVQHLDLGKVIDEVSVLVKENNKNL